MNNKQFISSVGLFIIVILVSIGIALLDPQQENEGANNSTSHTESNLKDSKYINDALNFSIDVPKGVEVDKILNDDYNKLARFKGVATFEIRLRAAGSNTLQDYLYLDMEPVGDSTLGGRLAKVFEASNGYCDGPMCGDPFVAYAAYHNGYFYNLVFYGDTALNQNEKTVLESFKFIE